MDPQKRLSKYGHIMMTRVQIPSTTQTNLIFFPIERKTFRFNHKMNDYNRMLTQNRLTEVEMDQILSDIEVPLQEYYREFTSLYNGMWRCYAVICAILVPLFFIYICWMASTQNRAVKRMAEARQKIEEIVRQKNQELERRDLYLNLPEYFPNWISLWTTLGPRPQMPGCNYPQMMPMMMVKPGFQMEVVPQGQPVCYNDQQNGYGGGSHHQFQA